MEVEYEWNEEMESMIDTIFKILKSKVNWKYLIITFPRNFDKQIKDEDHEEIQSNPSQTISLKEVSIYSENNINGIESFTIKLLEHLSEFQITELILSGFLVKSLKKIFKEIPLNYKNEIQFLRWEGNQEWELFLKDISSFGFSSLVNLINLIYRKHYRYMDTK